MFRKGFRIGKIFGIDIEIHWSWFFILALFTLAMATRYLPPKAPNQPPISYWIFGAAIVLILFASALVHELAHSRVAQRFKIPVKRITLLFLGGMAQMGERTKSANAEFWMAIAGPFASFVLAGIFWLLAKLLLLNVDAPLLIVSLKCLAFLNLLLGAFNLLPGYPMDGGRILKAAWWHVSKDELKATKVASYFGKAVAILMIVAGLWKLGLWFILIGWFLLMAAGREYKQLLYEKALREGRVRDAAEGFPFQAEVGNVAERQTCSPEDSLMSVIEKMARGGHLVLYVVENDRIIGRISRRDIEVYIRRFK